METFNTNNQYGFLSNTLLKLRTISKSMSHFLSPKAIGESITTVLQEILEQSNASRVYLLKYDSEGQAYNCIYEVTSIGVSEEKENLVNISEKTVPWWHQQVSQCKPVVISSLDNLPREAYNEYKLLKRQQIKSLIIVPVFTGKEVYACLGLDIVEDEYHWTDTDIESLYILANMLGVCIKFSETDHFLEKALHQLSAREKMLSTIFKNSPAGYELYDEKGRLIDNNKADMDIFGIKDSKDTMGINLFKNPHLSNKAATQLLAGQKVSFDIVYNFTKASTYYDTYAIGEKYLLVQIIPIFEENTNKLVNYLLMVVNKTDLGQLSDEVKDFEKMFSEISDFAKVGYVKWNFKTQKGYAIKQWYINWGESLQMPMKEIVNHHSKVHPDDLKILNDFINSLYYNPYNKFNGLLRISDGMGGWKWIRLLTIVSRFDNENLEVIGLNFDVTQTKELEQTLIDAKEKAETMDKFKSAFLATMSHEIRTPLNSIIGFSNLLVESENISSELKQKYQGLINSNSDLLLELVNDILDLSKIEAGTIEIIEGTVNVNELLQIIEATYSSKMKKGVQLIVKIPDTPCFMKGDKNRILQIISNFITNSIKFTKHGFIKVSYQLQDDNIEFSIEDSGIGIAADNLDRIFQSFVKLDNSEQGSGLGLAICKRLAIHMQGNVGVESIENEGSRFWFRIPFVAKQKSTTKTKQKKTIITSEKPLVLVVEDNESNYQLVSSLLEECRICWARNGKEALNLYESQRPDIILMDIKMPIMNGIDATREIRKTDKDTPIIALTAYAFESDKALALSAGCNAFITKPIKIQELLLTIKKYIGK